MRAMPASFYLLYLVYRASTVMSPMPEHARQALPIHFSPPNSRSRADMEPLQALVHSRISNRIVPVSARELISRKFGLLLKILGGSIRRNGLMANDLVVIVASLRNTVLLP